MNRQSLYATAAISLTAILTATSVVAATMIVGADDPIRPTSELGWVNPQPGDSYGRIVSRYGLACSSSHLWGANGRASLDPMTIVLIPPECRPGEPTTTTVPTTTVAPTTTTAAPTTTTTTSTSTTTTTASATTTTTVPATTTTTVDPEPPASGFLEDFNGEADALDRFAVGVFHRDSTLVAQQQWQADHALTGGGDCTEPTQTHTVHRSSPGESFFTCASVGGDPGKGHMMTSVGDTSGYSIAWFTPDDDGDGEADVFTAGEQTSVSWDVNVTNLGNRQWWEVVILPVDAPFLTTIDWVASTANIEPYHDDTIAVGKGPFGNDGNIFSGGQARDPLSWAHVCGDFAADPEGCASKAIRRSFSITDNGNGTITFEFLGQTYTYAGEFPDEFVVYFKDHNYTPNKDGMPVGHTWHWDNIAVQ